MQERHFVLIVQESNYPQMGALYLANALLPFGIVTHTIGSSVSREELDDLISAVDPIAVGCSVMTAPEIIDFVRHSLHIQTAYNKHSKHISVIWGGMHPTIVSEQTEKEPYIDTIVSGEAEITLPRLLNNLIKTNRLPEQKFVSSETPLHLDDLRPRWEDVDIARYLFPESHSVHARVNFTHESIFYYLLTSRGCMYKCNFCWEVARTKHLKDETILRGDGVDRTWRAHSAEWVKTQLTYLEARLEREGKQLDGVGFWDDMIFGRGTEEDRTRAKTIFSMMRERKFGFLLEARANQLIKTDGTWNSQGLQREADLYRALKEYGCVSVFVGTESANQETLNGIQKGTKARDYRRLVELSRDVGLPLRFSMIVGFPNEAEASVNDTLDLIEKLEAEPYISVSGPKLFTPYPGVPQYYKAVQRGMQVPKDTLGWAYLTRYGDYRAVYPWLTEDYSAATLRRIETFWEKIEEEKKGKINSELVRQLMDEKEQVIVDIVRSH